MSVPVHVILVPQGAEYQAVCRGLSRIALPTPPVVPLPVGPAPVRQHLQRLQQDKYLAGCQQVLVMGLCGSLNPRLCVGEVVLYQDCVYETETATPSTYACDRSLTIQLQQRLQTKASLVRCLTSERLIWSQQEKHNLGQVYQADVVDMEGFAALEVLTQAGMTVTMLRVISDDCQHDLPNLNSAVSANGRLQPLPLALRMLQRPIAATRLVQGALQGLKVLQAVTTTLFE